MRDAKQTRFRALLLAIGVMMFSPGLARADYLTIGAQLSCTDDAAVVQISGAWSDTTIQFPDLSGVLDGMFDTATAHPEMQCAIGSGGSREIRVKLGEMQKHAFGACGAAQRNFLSLWIDGHKVISRKTVFDGCGMDGIDRNLAAIVYRDSSLLYCVYPGKSDIADPVGDAKLTCVDASEVYTTALRTPIDTVEYPTDGSPRREGHVVLTASNQPELCPMLHEAFADDGYFFGYMDGIPVGISGASPMPNNPSLLEIDIDNDARDDIIWLRERTYRVNNHIAMVRDGRDRMTPELTLPGQDVLRLAIDPQNSLLPHSETVFRAVNGAGPAAVQMDPFIWQGQSYILAQAYANTFSPKWAVYQLQPDHSVAEICVLDRVQINY